MIHTRVSSFAFCFVTTLFISGYNVCFSLESQIISTSARNKKENMYMQSQRNTLCLLDASQNSRFAIFPRKTYSTKMYVLRTNNLLYHIFPCSDISIVLYLISRRKIHLSLASFITYLIIRKYFVFVRMPKCFLYLKRRW